MTKTTLFALAATLAACATTETTGGRAQHGGHPGGERVVHNHTGYAIFHLHLSPTGGAGAFGEDQLRGQTLHNGNHVTLAGVACGRYDLRVVDEDGDACVLRDQDLCHEGVGLTLNSAQLADCPGWTQQ